MILMKICRSETAASQIAKLIKDRRRDLGLSQDELARRVGVSRLSIINIESGRSNARVSTIVGILNILKVTLEAREKSYERRISGDDRQAD
jgi:transcriptional regulator with XRE-family HTH domain